MSSHKVLRLPTLLALLLAAFTLTLNTGCIAVAAGAGAGAVAWVKGELRTTVTANLDRSVRAAGEAVRELQFVKVSERKDALEAVIIARSAADRKIQIKLENVGGALTTVKIRVGTFGNEAVSLAILDKIKSNL